MGVEGGVCVHKTTKRMTLDATECFLKVCETRQEKNKEKKREREKRKTPNPLIGLRPKIVCSSHITLSITFSVSNRRISVSEYSKVNLLSG